MKEYLQDTCKGHIADHFLVYGHLWSYTKGMAYTVIGGKVCIMQTDDLEAIASEIVWL